MVPQSNSRLRVQDRVSELPDAVLCHILSFLGPDYAKCAVRTSILSKRWKNMWACAPTVNLNSRDFSSSADFIAFADRFLLLRDSSTIQKLYLHFILCSAEDFSRVDAWIRTAIRCNVVELDLCVYSDGVCFPSLKFFYVTVPTDKDSMDFSHCPALEHLTIDGYHGEDGVYLNISVSELKTLKITSTDIYSVNINAPKLEKLDLKESVLSDYDLENTKSLVEANIYLYHEEEEGDEEDAAVCATNLLEGISGVKYLFLSSRICENCSVPAFDNLSKLTLALHSGCYGWGILTMLLERASNLECLVLEHDHHHYPAYCESVIELEDPIEVPPEVVIWSPPESVPKCVSSHLKSVSLKGFQGKHFWGHVDEMEVLKYLLENGQVLKEMTIYTEFLEQELYGELSRFEWGSETCQVEIIN
ncbi:putative F-box domain, FBD domain, leucine-rich repeat domain, L domain-containing protein [Rosa chinensis]|uniref:Putative F-box domain, FBD domain, leucine-rich repeat domain, L domain-containing protein n=1 Tax=Rosa chinensis TaxID=74649 RepID=A0A2P6Q9E3_ROSCH|nr:F-box/LRR-repeat protein At3g59200 isoform X2 [Rosa chinensis]PRQ30796.1 putative F-box domain, FBD domain, leucine-rich repeat domain, L domain-containing protein [Rosa chinensis]